MCHSDSAFVNAHFPAVRFPLVTGDARFRMVLTTGK